MSPHGPMQFALPSIRPVAEVLIDGKKETPPLRLETVLFEPGENRLCLSWRAAQPCDRKVLKIESVSIGVA